MLLLTDSDLLAQLDNRTGSHAARLIRSTIRSYKKAINKADAKGPIPEELLEELHAIAMSLDDLGYGDASCDALDLYYDFAD